MEGLLSTGLTPSSLLYDIGIYFCKKECLIQRSLARSIIPKTEAGGSALDST